MKKREESNARAREEKKAKIIERMIDGESPSEIYGTQGLPKSATVWRWRQDDAEFAAQFDRALKCYAESLIMGCTQLSDEAAVLAGNRECGSAMVAAKKLQIDTRIKIAARLDRSRFAEHLTQEVKSESSVRAKYELAPEQLAVIAREEAAAAEKIAGKVR